MKYVRRVSLTQWILIGMAVGVLLGVLFPAGNGGFEATELKPLSTIFLRMIKSIIVPIIFSTLVIGVAGHGDDMKRVGRLALKSLVYFEVVTTIALFIGLAAVNLVRPGVGVTLHAPATTGADLAAKGHELTLGSFLEHMVPQSFAESA
ncbi:MAG TPA: cation:dicarboxylase symporter family transporter, partial [Longimicrobiaceae bacterium]